MRTLFFFLPILVACSGLFLAGVVLADKSQDKNNGQAISSSTTSSTADVLNAAAAAASTLADVTTMAPSLNNLNLQSATSFVSSLWRSGALDKPVEQARALLPLGFPATFMGALAGITLVGAFKLGLFFVTSFWLLTAAFPATLAFFGLSSPFLLRSLKDTIPVLRDMNEEFIARSINSLPDSAMDLIAVKGRDCRARAICEAGEFMARKFPWLASLARSVMDRFRLEDGYVEAMWRGLAGGVKTSGGLNGSHPEVATCAAAFKSCTTSPYKKITNMSFL